jgi:hypothetical protein
MAGRIAMQNQKWTDERLEAVLAKSGQTTILLSSKSRGKVQRALLEENARLREQNNSAQKPRRGWSALLAALSNH